MDILRVQNLSCGYGDREVIKNMSFSVKAGDFLGVIGPNGAGKTTLFRAITRVLTPLSGSVFYREKEISTINPRDFAREVAVIPQILEIPFAFTVEEFALMGRFPHEGRFEFHREKNKRLLEKALIFTDTLNLRKRKIFELSGGERQRVILAQGFVQEPRLILLDEPITHLDIAHQVGIMDLIRRLNKEFGLTVIMVLHNLNLASEYCHRLALFNEGRVHKIGSPEEVMDYRTIEKVYKTAVVVEKSPVSRKPHVFVVPEEQIKK